MSKGFVARQPILDQNKRLFAYEILYRESMDDNFCPLSVDGDFATSSIWINIFFNTNINKIANGKKIFINIPSVNFLKTIEETKPESNIVFEILETVSPSMELLDTIKKMSSNGHVFALDDFIYSEKWLPFFPFISYIKFDVNDINIKELGDVIRVAKENKIKLLLEKVETFEQFSEAKKIGFDYFQGYFFEKPENIRLDGVSHNKEKLLILSNMINSGVDKHKLTKVLESDLGLYYHFLTFSKQISNLTGYRTLDETILNMSDKELMAFISMVVSVNNIDSSDIVIKSLAMQRLCFCFLLSSRVDLFKKFKPYAKNIGFLSCIASMINKDEKNIFEEISVDPIYSEALIYKRGEIYKMIMLCNFYENGMWDRIEKFCKGNGISIKVLDNIYTEAVKYADQKVV
tara:strand:- start:1450 stop:2661 length:1212 start_codon:yes stop_codon:yes gene_type:complete